MNPKPFVALNHFSVPVAMARSSNKANEPIFSHDDHAKKVTAKNGNRRLARFVRPAGAGACRARREPGPMM
jgi:hypothetical protein